MESQLPDHEKLFEDSRSNWLIRYGILVSGQLKAASFDSLLYKSWQCQKSPNFLLRPLDFVHDSC